MLQAVCLFALFSPKTTYITSSALSSVFSTNFHVIIIIYHRKTDFLWSTRLHIDGEAVFFQWKYNYDDKGELTEAGQARIKTVITFSKECKDVIYIELEDKLQSNPELALKCPRNCVSTYTSSQHLSRHKKRVGSSDETASKPLKRQRRSEVSTFRFKQHCLFCGEACEIEKDKKHPDRWKRAVLCRTVCTSPSQKSFKQSILDVCTKCDEIAHQVRVRVEGAVSDLHAADAWYHVNCMTSFMSPNPFLLP